MIKAQKCFNLGWLGRKTELLRRVGGKELSFVLAVIVSSIGKRLWLISSGQRSWESGWKVQPGHLVTILMNVPSAQQRTQIREKPTRIRRKNWLSSMAFLKILKAWKGGVLRNTWSAEVKNSSSKDSQKCRGRCESERNWRAKNDHNLDKCQHKGKEAAERRLLHVANRDKAQR